MNTKPVVLQFSKGNYKTRCGYDATVAAVKHFEGLGWRVLGSIEEPTTRVLHLHTWTIEGLSTASTENGGRMFDLVKQ